MENTEQTQEQLSALLQVRRDKLTELQNDGRDPFKITKFERTHTSAQLKENYTEEDRELKKRGSDEVQIIKAQVSQFDGQTVSIAGRIMSKRDTCAFMICTSSLPRFFNSRSSSV